MLLGILAYMKECSIAALAFLTVENAICCVCGHYVLVKKTLLYIMVDNRNGLVVGGGRQK